MSKRPEEFSLELYRTEGGQLTYVTAVLEDRGLTLPEEEVIHLLSMEHANLVGSFFRKSGYGPETKLGQLVQVVACIDKQSIDLTHFSRNDREDIARQIDSRLRTLRAVANDIGHEIFGDSAADHIRSIREQYIARYPETEHYQRAKRRSRALEAITQDARQNFPLTSR